MNLQGGEDLYSFIFLPRLTCPIIVPAWRKGCDLWKVPRVIERGLGREIPHPCCRPILKLHCNSEQRCKQESRGNGWEKHHRLRKEKDVFYYSLLNFLVTLSCPTQPKVTFNYYWVFLWVMPQALHHKLNPCLLVVAKPWIIMQRQCISSGFFSPLTGIISFWPCTSWHQGCCMPTCCRFMIMTTYRCFRQDSLWLQHPLPQTDCPAYWKRDFVS